MQNAFSTIARHSRVALVVVGALACPVIGTAQPAETPPPDVVGTFVDSAGCVWQRVDIGEQVAWAALLQADGAQLCGMVPTVPVESAEVAAEPVVAPETETAPEIAPETSPEIAAPEVADEAEPPAKVAESDAVVRAPAKPKVRRPDFPRPGYYLQVGAFRDPVNADRAVTFVQGLGLGALRQTSSAKVRPLQIIYAGPFAVSSEARAARAMVRKIGYGDAFIWEPS